MPLIIESVHNSVVWRPRIRIDHGFQTHEFMSFGIYFQGQRHGMVIEVGDVIRLGNQNVRVFLLVFYMPVRVVGEPVELQRQFIMIVAFRVVVCRGVFTQHEPVYDRAGSHPFRVDGAVIPLHLDIGAVRHVILFYVFQVFVLRFVLSLSLHVFVEKKRLCDFRMGFAAG